MVATSDVGSIPIARSINPVDAVGFYWLPTPEIDRKFLDFGRQLDAKFTSKFVVGREEPGQ